MSSIVRIDYIGASWCRVCTTVKPGVEQLAKEFGVELNVLDADALSGEDEVTKVPTLRLYKSTGDPPSVSKERIEIVTKHLEALKTVLVSNAKVIINDDF
jgi:thiol-disulfide isomerase/thioredoxin